MIVTNMKQAKFKCRECDCCSLNCGIKKKKIGYKTTHTFTKRIEDKANDNNNNNINNNNNNNNNSNNNNNDDGINNDNDNSTDNKIKTKIIKLKNK